MLAAEIGLDCSYLLAILMVVLVCIVIHEVGHAATGAICGLRVRLFRAGPFQWSLRTERGKTSWNFRFRRNLTSGLTSFSARSLTSKHLIIRYTLSVVAGPLANAALSIVAAFLLAGFRGPIALFGGATVCCSLGYAFANLVPFTTKDSLDSDGMVLWRLATSLAYRQAVRAQLCFILRLEAFRHDFAAGRLDIATDHLLVMRSACRTPRQKVMRSIVDHLQEHLESGQSMESCSWNPVPVSTAAVASNKLASTSGQ